jgi:hypothetical protein
MQEPPPNHSTPCCRLDGQTPTAPMLPARVPHRALPQARHRGPHARQRLDPKLVQRTVPVRTDLGVRTGLLCPQGQQGCPGTARPTAATCSTGNKQRGLRREGRGRAPRRGRGFQRHHAATGTRLHMTRNNITCATPILCAPQTFTFSPKTIDGGTGLRQYRQGPPRPAAVSICCA